MKRIIIELLISLVVMILGVIVLLAMPVIAAGSVTPVEDIAKVIAQKGYVYDGADILTDAEEKQLYDKLAAWKDTTSNELAIVIVGTTGDIGEQQYSIQLAEKLAVGDEEKDNGLLLLVAIADRKFFMQVGEGLEGALPDGKIGLLLGNTLPPKFKQKQYHAGLDDVVTQVIGIVGGEFTIDEKISTGPSVMVVFLVLGVIFLIFIMMLASKAAASGSGSWSSRGGGSTYSSGGFLGSVGGSSGGGGFGGFGGGGFSGGGGGGGW